MNETMLAAHDHVRRMEVRIEHQAALIVRLKQSGTDTLEAAKKLVLLRDTLDEMRVQLGVLAPGAAPAAQRQVAAQ